MGPIIKNCPKCDSKNITVSLCRPGTPAIIDLLLKLGPRGKRWPGGRQYITCKDCGQMSVIHVM